MRALLEKNELKEWIDDFVYMSKSKFMDLGVEVIAFNGDNLKTLEALNPSKNDILIGSVEATERFFNLIGVPVPNYIGYPESLKKYLHRNIETMKFSELDGKTFPYFVKPKNGVKAFTGSLVQNETQKSFLVSFDNVISDTELYVSDPINFITEYRCFVHKKELKGIQYYLGDFKKFPSIETIESMIRDYDNCNVSYTLDVGVLENGETALVEVNDMWAIGSYGFDAKTYVRMSIDRFVEIYAKAKV
jgi:hypothetical protein